MPADTLVERELAAIEAALEGRPVDPDMTEIAELAALLRDDRMEIDPFFARELDARAAAGFPRESRWRRRWRLTANPMLVPGAAACMLLALMVSVALITSGGPSFGGDEAESGGGGVAYSPESAPELDAGGSGEQATSGASGQAAPPVKRAKRESRSGSGGGSAPTTVAPVLSAPPVPGGGSPKADRRSARKVETSASVVLSTRPEDVQRVANQVVEVTDAHRGFVVTSSVEVSDGGGGATFELRVPSERLKPVLADLSRIADVKERREATQDITREFVSAGDRLADARADRKGLLRRLERADSDAERARIRYLLRVASSRISAAKADLARVDNRASYSTISATVTGDPAAAGGVDDGGSWTPGDAARDAVRVLEVAAGVALIALAIGLPLALLAGLALAVVRLTSRRRRERLLDAI